MPSNEIRQLSADTRQAIQEKAGHTVQRFLGFGVEPGIIHGKFLATDGKTYRFTWSGESLSCGEEA